MEFVINDTIVVAKIQAAVAVVESQLAAALVLLLQLY
jgi:hypothetical protein